MGRGRGGEREGEGLRIKWEMTTVQDMKQAQR